MNSKISVEQKYGGITLTYDDASFVHLCDAIFAEPSLGSTLNDSLKTNGINFITILRTAALKPRPSRHNRLALIPAIVAGVISAIATIVGFVVIAKWLMR